MLSIVILAAGSGTRMKSDTPKVLHKICGEELLFYSIECALKLSSDVCVVLGHQAQRVQEAIKKRFANQIQTTLQDCQNFPGTGGAIMAAKDYIQGERVLVLNADMPLIQEQSLRSLITSSPISIGVINSSNPFGYGRIILKNNLIEKIVEEKDADLATKAITLINSGIYVFQTSLLLSYLPKLNCNNAQKEYYLTDIISFATQDKVEIAGIKVNEEEFMGINDKAQLAIAEEIMLHRLRKKAMQEGVIMHNPSSIYLDKNVKFEGECEIEAGVQLRGNTLISHSHIKAHSVINDSQIIHSDIGPMAHIRPNCTINSSHIGNFVECKNAKLNKIKAGHLSYLGDCEIDEGSNIGAGVITCNYDGKNKHKTIIGKNVFVGSDSQLIAPLTINDYTLIAAGTTMRKDSQEGDLILSRVEQKNLKNGYFVFFKEKK